MRALAEGADDVRHAVRPRVQPCWSRCWSSCFAMPAGAGVSEVRLRRERRGRSRSSGPHAGSVLRDRSRRARRQRADCSSRRVARAFATWQAVPTASISYAFGGFTGSAARRRRRAVDAGIPERARARSRARRRRAFSSTTSPASFSSRTSSSTRRLRAGRSPPAASGPRGIVESIALHEIGHLSGLGHSAIGETEIADRPGAASSSIGAVMFPIALGAGDMSGRQLRPDDIAGISDLYPDGRFQRRDRAASPAASPKNGRGVFGAHVVAFDLGTRRAGRQLLAWTRRAVFDRRPASRARTSSASSRSTMRTSTVSSSRQIRSTSTSR